MCNVWCLMYNVWSIVQGAREWWLSFLMSTWPVMPVTFRPSLPSVSVLVMPGYTNTLTQTLTNINTQTQFYSSLILKKRQAEITKYCSFYLPSPLQELEANGSSLWCTSPWRSHSPASCASSLSWTKHGLAQRPGSGADWPDPSRWSDHEPGDRGVF